eukprot:g10853.t1
MPLEDRGVPYAMKPRVGAPFPECSREEYQYLADNYNCTRQRVFNVGIPVGTFNKDTNRGSSTACKGLHPRGEYHASTQNVRPAVIEPGMTRNGWPAPVRGGHIIDHIEPSDTQVRKHGGLERNIAGDCTVRDPFSYYTGYDSTHYGGNVGSRNRHQYRNNGGHAHK